MKKILALAAVLSMALLGAAAETGASAAPAPDSASARTAGMRATVTPKKPARYQTVTSKLTAKKSTSYYCTLTVYKAGISGGASLASTSSIVTVKTNKRGKATCRQTFIPFSGTWDGVRHYCPPTRADKRAGWKCGVGYANVNDLSQTTTALFGW